MDKPAARRKEGLNVKKQRKHVLRWLAITSIMAVAVSVAFALPGQAATSDKFVHGGNAYGVKVQVGGLLVVTPQVSADIGS